MTSNATVEHHSLCNNRKNPDSLQKSILFWRPSRTWGQKRTQKTEWQAPPGRDGAVIALTVPRRSKRWSPYKWQSKKKSANVLMNSFFLKVWNVLFRTIYFWLCWVFVAAHGLSLLVGSGSYFLLRCTSFSLQWLLLLPSTGSRLR